MKSSRTLIPVWMLASFLGAVPALAGGTLEATSPVPVSHSTAGIANYDFSGGYAGGMIGGALFAGQGSDLTNVLTNDAPPVNVLAATYGLYGGYNWALKDSNAIVGVELEYSFGLEGSEQVTTNATQTETLDFKNSWDSLAVIRFRAGMVTGKSMVYVAGGPAFATASYEITSTASGNTAKASENLLGVSIGAGVEHAFRENLIGRFEISHTVMPGTDVLLVNQGTGLAACGDPQECQAYFESSATRFSIGLAIKF